tara:strand:- start:526 stop:1923 length:1398 start_codon:yes stop_codon:yes gene_type:complete
MGLINQTQKEYYEGSDGVQNSGDENYGSYQFISLKNIINQFTIAYVGEDKIISKIKRADVAFHAQRALQELSFDTFKSTKSFEYVVPPSLQMPLPQDYVNYIKLCYVGADGIKRVLQKTNKSSNPAAYQQNADGSFKLETNSFIRNFKAGENRIGVDEDGNGIYSPSIPPTNEYEEYGITKSGKTTSGTGTGDVKSDNLLPKFAKETRVAVTNASGYVNRELAYGPGSNMQMNFFTANHDIEVGMTVFGPGIPRNTTVASVGSSTSDNYPGMGIIMTNPVYEKWLLDGSFGVENGYPLSPQILGEEVIFVNLNKQSTSWSGYKSLTPASTENDSYEDYLYWPNEGRRYGIDPQHAQVNGSYYIDDNTGLAYFSSSIAGKTIVLEYISDSLGTDEEMKVHKLAEEAMYKCIAYAIISTRANMQEYIVQRFKKDRFAATRTAKLRMSNLKIEELTQVLRGKSKQIKH